MFVGGFGICATSCTERKPRELRGPVSRPFVGPCSSSSKRLKQLRADCGLRRITALVDLERIADCTSGTLRRTSPSAG
eukprot:7494916-Alexandrium_andersonii.AAC.1